MSAGEESLRRRVYLLLEHPGTGPGLARVLDVALILLIIANVIAVTLETVPGLYAAHRASFRAFDTLSVTVFTLEYILRVWASAEGAPGLATWRARLRYMRSPMALIDLAAVLPFFIGLLFTSNLQMLRILRLLRIYKLTRYSPALSVLIAVIREESGALLAAFSILTILLVFAATGAYLVEHQAQPSEFGSIPAAMWWALVTLTTVGYGDVTPITPLGRVFGGFITVLGVGMAALPAGIIASGLADHLHRRRDHLRNEFRLALEDGRIDLEEGRQIERLRRELGISRDIAHAILSEVRLRQVPRGPCSCPVCGHVLDSGKGDGGGSVHAREPGAGAGRRGS
ncbi:ion transporter [Pseudooceanicola sp. CBS1P-1]|uniref:Ion transporter n=1 Tax=Pseudooceanicola albus TaxID=2692189 RepID=A0A6L7G507_9RHOB|nr:MULTISPECIES: ion transporter [Pseudooceanicola]MBT9386139.1 ion transporter [Pseudooceanicola endophyticus]MXN19444.1 ion transporter [Pseudooceanicola albus]